MSTSHWGYMCIHMISSWFLPTIVSSSFWHFISTLREVVLIPNRHWGGEGLLGCIFGWVFYFRSLFFNRLNPLIISFGLLHRIPAQPEDRAPGTLPAELQEQGDEYGGQDLFVPADVEIGGGQHSPSQLAEWRQQEQEQWNREVLARSSHTQPTHTSSSGAGHNHQAHDPFLRSHPTAQTVNSRPSGTQDSMRFSSTTDFSTPTPTRNSLSNSVNGDLSTQSWSSFALNTIFGLKADHHL